VRLRGFVEQEKSERRTCGVETHHDAEASTRSFHVAIIGTIVVSVIEGHLMSVITDREGRESHESQTKVERISHQS
jgi:uncharacterized protein (DUF983 family)